MSTDNVTPIRPEATKLPKPPRKRRPRVRVPEYQLRFSGGETDDAPHALMIWQGLRGVSRAANDSENMDPGFRIELAAAADVLSWLLAQREV